MYARVNAASIASLAVALWLTACGGTPELRSPDGQLAPCAGGGCVSSHAAETGSAVRPIVYSGTREAARLALTRLIADMPGAELVEQREDYVHATFTSLVLRSVDDLELDFPPHERVVHIRAASRGGLPSIGNSNLERVEQLRARFDAVQP